MSGKFDEKKLFTRRAFIFVGVKAFLGIGVISRLAYLQLFNSKHYRLLSDRNRIVTSQILPARGRILDCNGNVIAGNINSYSVELDLFDLSQDKRKEVIENIIQHAYFDVDILEKLKTLKNQRQLTDRFILLKEHIDWEGLSSFYVLSSFVPCLNIEKNLSRNYIDPEIFSHIIGYVGAPSKSDIDIFENRALLLPTAKVGKCCIEKEYNNQLFGKAGIKHVEVNSKRQVVRVIDEIKSVPGTDIHLTINKNLQRFVYDRLSREKSASCVVMNVKTGAILAFVSYPGYDINIFNKKIDKKLLEDLYKNPYKPIINKALSGVYSPGSTFKVITGLAGLHKGVIDQHTKFHCEGFFDIGRYRYHCWRWRYGGHGKLNLREALTKSCDVFFYNVAMRLSPDNISEVANDFGLGVSTNIDIAGEKIGLMPTKSWKKFAKKQSWTKGDTINMSIGQGFTLATPLQLTRMISILVNGLKPISPYICALKNKVATEKLKYKQEHIDIILAGMADVVNSPVGTAYKSRLEKIRFGGKTGSTQVFKISEQQRKAFKTLSDEYWLKDHALFVGYAPTDSPRVATCVVVEHGEWGASRAAPIARDVIQEIHNQNIMKLTTD
jgi:penicillin-binding protein 2